MAYRIKSFEMTQYLLEALSIQNPDETPWSQTFYQHNYAGSMIDLFALVEHILLTRRIIPEKHITINGEEKIAKVPMSAWGCGWHNVGYETSMEADDINLFFEGFHYLISQQIISPGWVRNSESLPFFHVTQYGLKCIAERDILPYDSNGFLNEIQSCTQHDDWDIFYIDQCLKCFNAGVYNAATTMLGIEGEYLAEKLIYSYSKFLDKNEPTEKNQYETILNGITKISQKYEKYKESLKRVNKLPGNQGNPKYPDLNKIMPSLDGTANSVFLNYLRMTRNELAHPSKIVIEPSETMLIIVSFLKYLKIQSKFLDFYIQNS